MNKFKIIEEKNVVTGNISHYELWWHRPMFWNKDRWVPERVMVGRGVSVTKKFGQISNVTKYIEENYIPRLRTEILEGVVDGNLGIQRSNGVGQ
jgi:hypothetical protein